MIVYGLIATCNACVWTALAVLLGASTGRAAFFFLLTWLVMFFGLLFVAGCHQDCADREDDYRTRFYQ